MKCDNCICDNVEHDGRGCECPSQKFEKNIIDKILDKFKKIKITRYNPLKKK